MIKSLIASTFLLLCFIGCQADLDEQWGRDKYTQHKTVIDELDRFFVAEFEAFNPISDTRRDFLFDSLRMTNDTIYNTGQFLLKSNWKIDQIEKEHLRQAEFEEAINERLNANTTVNFWKFDYEILSDGAQNYLDCDQWTGTYNSNIHPDNGITLDNRNIGWGFFQPLDDEGNYVKEQVAGLHLNWFFETSEARLTVELVILDED